MKYFKYLALLATATLLFPLSALARDRNEHSVEIADSVQIGSTLLKPGSYKVEWQEAGPAVHVKFIQNGKTVLTAPGTLKTDDVKVFQDDVVTQSISAHKKVLKEIDFGRQKEALLFG